MAPVYDYAATVWMHTVRAHSSPSVNMMQKIRAQAIVGTFHTVAEAMAEAEAAILPVKQRHDIRAIRTVAEAFILSENHPLYGLKNSDIKRFALLMQKLRTCIRDLKVEDMEILETYIASP